MNVLFHRTRKGPARHPGPACGGTSAGLCRIMRDVRDAWYETLFYSVWGSPWVRWFGRKHEGGRTL